MNQRKTHFQHLVFFSIILFFSGNTLTLNAQDFQEKQDVFETFTDDYIEGQNQVCESCNDGACSVGAGTNITAPVWLRYSILSLLALSIAFVLKRKFGWQAVGILLVLFVLGFIPDKHVCFDAKNQNENVVLFASSSFAEPEKDEKNNVSEDTRKDDFKEFTDDDFEQFSDDEFSEFSNEFNSGFIAETSIEKEYTILSDPNFILSIEILLLTLLAGILIKFKATRKLRVFFLIGSVVYLGFINGACPCMISSFQNVILFLAGVPVKPVLFIWFLGLIPLTYFFGKVWCGWVCHLGALQEFIYRPGILSILKNQKSQIILKYFRIVVLAILIVQLLITKTNIFIHYDPFKVAFNLFSANTPGYILLVLLLGSSLLIYRPFCRAFCPIGLILGWVTYIPGSSKLQKNNSCIDCKSCSNSCKYNAMVYENKKSILNNDDCILCGDCFESCKFNSLEIKGIAKK